MMRDWHWWFELGTHRIIGGAVRYATGYGLRFGYWPCLRAPYIELSLGRYRWRVWWGDCSYRNECRRHEQNRVEPGTAIELYRHERGLRAV